MTSRPTEHTVLTPTIAPSDGFGALLLSSELDDSAQAPSVDIRYRPVSSSQLSEINLLRLVLDASDAIRWHVPCVEPYLGNRMCPRCGIAAAPGDGLCCPCRDWQRRESHPPAIEL